MPRSILPRNATTQKFPPNTFCWRCSDSPEGLARPLLETLTASGRPSLRTSLKPSLRDAPSVHRGASPNLGADLRRTLDAAEGEMAKLKDEYLSAEHFLLALLDSGTPRQDC